MAPLKKLILFFILEICFSSLLQANSYEPEGSYSVIQEDVIGNEVKCLVCKASIKELEQELKKVDPSKTEDVGGYGFDSEGNLKKKVIPQVQSEIFISDLIDTICRSMEMFVRGRWKSNGELTLLRLIGPDGKMNTDIGDVDLIQDEDLNKSLEFYCKSVFEEYEENVIHHFQKGSSDVINEVCVNESRLCPKVTETNKENKEEL